MVPSRGVGRACIAFGLGGEILGANINTASSNGPDATDHVPKRPLNTYSMQYDHPSVGDLGSSGVSTQRQASENRHVA